MRFTHFTIKRVAFFDGISHKPNDEDVHFLKKYENSATMDKLCVGDYDFTKIYNEDG